jgi:integrase
MNISNKHILLAGMIPTKRPPTCPGGIPLNFDLFVNSIWHQLHISAKTLADYKSEYNRNLLPYLGNCSINMIQKKQIIEAISILPPQTAYKTLMVAKTLFREAQNRELIDENPATQIKSPKIVVKPQKFLTWEELSPIDFGSQTKRIRFLALHGLRFGEASALTKDDIINGRVFIKRSKWGETKTPAGVRSVPLMSEFVSFPKYQDSIAKALKPYGINVHSLRKTYAYLLKTSDIHVTTAAKLLGHSNPMVTMKIYTQVLDSEIDQSGEALKNYIKLAG